MTAAPLHFMRLASLFTALSLFGHSLLFVYGCVCSICFVRIVCYLSLCVQVLVVILLCHLFHCSAFGMSGKQQMLGHLWTFF